MAGPASFLRPALIGFSPRQQAVIVEEAHKRGKRGRDACDEFGRT